MIKKRTREEIIFDILSVIERLKEEGKKPRKTYIQYRTNLSIGLRDKYFALLKTADLINENTEEENGRAFKVYDISKKGEEYRKDLGKVLAPFQNPSVQPQINPEIVCKTELIQR